MKEEKCEGREQREGEHDMGNEKLCVYRSGNRQAGLELSSVHGRVGPAAASDLKSLWLAVLYPRSQLPQATSCRVWWSSSLHSVVIVVATLIMPHWRGQFLGHWWVLNRAKVESMTVIPEGQCHVGNWTLHPRTMKSLFCGPQSSRQGCLHFKEEAIAY